MKTSFIDLWTNYWKYLINTQKLKNWFFFFNVISTLLLYMRTLKNACHRWWCLLKFETVNCSTTSINFYVLWNVISLCSYHFQDAPMWLNHCVCSCASLQWLCCNFLLPLTNQELLFLSDLKSKIVFAYQMFALTWEDNVGEQ